MNCPTSCKLEGDIADETGMDLKVLFEKEVKRMNEAADDSKTDCQSCMRRKEEEFRDEEATWVDFVGESLGRSDLMASEEQTGTGDDRRGEVSLR